jgi:hypothetical protein
MKIEDFMPLGVYIAVEIVSELLVLEMFVPE